MFRSNFKELKLIKFVLKFFSKKPRKLETPWQGELDNLAARYENSLKTTTYEVVGESGSKEEQDLRRLCNEVKEDLEENNDRIVVRRVEKRTTDNTAVDLKAWWGQSVATWDPINAKNVDSIDQTRRPRKSKWFDKKG